MLYKQLKTLIMCLPCSSVLLCLFGSLTSPPPAELCSDAPLCCCGWLPPVCGIYSVLLLPAQHRSSVSGFIKKRLLIVILDLFQSGHFQLKAVAISGRLICRSLVLLDLCSLDVHCFLQLCSILLQLLDFSTESVV